MMFCRCCTHFEDESSSSTDFASPRGCVKSMSSILAGSLKRAAASLSCSLRLSRWTHSASARMPTKSSGESACFFGASCHSRKAFAIPKSFIAFNFSIVCSISMRLLLLASLVSSAVRGAVPAHGAPVLAARPASALSGPSVVVLRASDVLVQGQREVLRLIEPLPVESVLQNRPHALV